MSWPTLEVQKLVWGKWVPLFAISQQMARGEFVNMVEHMIESSCSKGLYRILERGGKDELRRVLVREAFRA